MKLTTSGIIGYIKNMISNSNKFIEIYNGGFTCSWTEHRFRFVYDEETFEPIYPIFMYSDEVKTIYVRYEEYVKLFRLLEFDSKSYLDNIIMNYFNDEFFFNIKNLETDKVLKNYEFKQS